jgi:hypothetical protein
MSWNTNFTEWLRGGTLNNEQAETREAWTRTEAAWRASPLASDRAVFDLAVATMREAAAQVEQPPASGIAVELSMITDLLLSQEDILPIDVDWRVVEGDAAAAVEFRQMMQRRGRWAREYERHAGIVKRDFATAYAAFYRQLPESCFRPWRPDAGLFEVPLVELLEDPATAVSTLLWAPYDPDAFRLDMFRDLRQTFERNLLVASGLPPTADPKENEHRLVFPANYRGRNNAELVEAYLGHTPFASVFELPVPFELPEETRFEHVHIVGGTGHGKTQLMQRMIHADILAAKKEKRSVVVIDSQGDMLARLTRLGVFDPDDPDCLADRLIIIDPADVEFPPSLNLFDVKLDRLAEYRPVDRERVLNGVVELYETFFGALLGAELTQKQGVVFKYLARLMLTIPGATIHTLMQLMEDGRPFKPQMEKLEGSARYFFETEFFHPGFAATKKQILRRLWGVLSTPAFERMFAQKDNKLDLFQAMQDGKIILINTAKDLLKQEGSQLFGRFFIAMLAQATLERSTLRPEERTPTFVYVDEAQEYFDDTVETILNQARKYRVGLTVAHQTLDQLTPRLRAVLHANTAMKCAGGVSARDARALADELHTTHDFIESMKRRQGKTEFAVWIRQQTPRAIRLAVPLGYVERQPGLSEEAYDALLDQNRVRYCGTLADVGFARPVTAQPEHSEPTRITPEETPPSRPAPATERQVPEPPRPEPFATASRPAARPREMGKGGPKHRYLQQFVKELAEGHEFRATIEAPLPNGGQVDVLLERDGLAIPVEVSVSTPAEWERENIRKCLAAGFDRIALVLAKTDRTQARYRENLLGGLSDDERGRITLLAPEDVPDFLARLGEPPPTTETVVKGYRVRVSHAEVSPQDARDRRDRIAGLVARSLSRQGDASD